MFGCCLPQLVGSFRLSVSATTGTAAVCLLLGHVQSILSEDEVVEDCHAKPNIYVYVYISCGKAEANDTTCLYLLEGSS